MDIGKHRSDKMLCDNCMWFKAKGIYNTKLKPTCSDVKVGRCRKRAPTMGGFPVIFSNDWCGDFRLRENVIEDDIVFTK